MTFPEPPKGGRYSGMTVNERLYDAGLLDRFNAAARDRNRDAMIALLASVGLEDDAPRITDTILANPTKYGY